MYNTASVLIFVGFLTITGYGKPLMKSSEEDTVEDVKLNTCAADVIKLIAQQEKNHEVDLSTMSEECQKLVNNALNDEKIDKNENKRDDNDGSGDGSVSEEEFSSVVASLSGTRDAWRVTVDNVLYHLLKALEVEHEKLQKTLKWVAEIQDNQNKQFEGNFSEMAPETSEGSGEYTLNGNILNDKRKRTEEDIKGSRADRMKELYNDITTGEFQQLMKNKPPPFKPNWNENKVEEKEIFEGKESASEPPEENEEQENNIEESESEIPEVQEDGEVERENSASETPNEQEVEKKKATDIDSNQTPKEKRLISAEVDDRDEKKSEVDEEDYASEIPAGESRVDIQNSASETLETTEEGVDFRKYSASETPTDEVADVDGEDSASETADERAEDGADRDDSASETPVEGRAKDEVEGKDSASETPVDEGAGDSASETPADERAEDAVDGEDSANETPTEENIFDRGESASKIPEEEGNGNGDSEDSASETQAEYGEGSASDKNQVTIEDSASEVPEEVDIEDSASEVPEEIDTEDSASEIPEEENEGSDEHKEKEYNNIGNNYISKTAKHQIVEHLKNADENKIQENNNEKLDAIEGKEFKRQPEVLIKSSNDITNTESDLVSDDLEFGEEPDQGTDSSASDLKDTIVNELKDLQNGDDSDRSHRTRAVEKALKKLSRQTHSDTD